LSLKKEEESMDATTRIIGLVVSKDASFKGGSDDQTLPFR